VLLQILTWCVRNYLRAADRGKTMKVGLFINTQFPEGFNLAERIPEMVAQVRSAQAGTSASKRSKC
jgi:hypothetical protein